MLQKVIQIGNSIGVIIPQVLQKNSPLKKGDVIDIEKNNGKYIVSLKKKLTGGVDARFMKMVDEFMDEHDDVLKELASR